MESSVKRSPVIEDIAAFRGISYEEAALQLFQDMIVDATEAKILGEKHFEVADKAVPMYVAEARRQALIEQTERKMTADVEKDK